MSKIARIFKCELRYPWKETEAHMPKKVAAAANALYWLWDTLGDQIDGTSGRAARKKLAQRDAERDFKRACKAGAYVRLFHPFKSINIYDNAFSLR